MISQISFNKLINLNFKMLELKWNNKPLKNNSKEQKKNISKMKWMKRYKMINYLLKKANKSLKAKELQKKLKNKNNNKKKIICLKEENLN